MASSILSPELNQSSQTVVWGIWAAFASSQTAWTRTNCFSHLCPWKCPCFVCKRQAREILPQIGSHPNWADGIMSLHLHSYSHPPLDSAPLSFNHRLQSCVLQQIHFRVRPIHWALCWRFVQLHRGIAQDLVNISLVKILISNHKSKSYIKGI